MNPCPDVPELGFTEALDWSSTATHYGLMTHGIKNTAAVKDYRPGIDTQAALNYASASGHFSSEATPYTLCGCAGVFEPGFHITGSASFGDELYLETFNGQPVILEFAYEIAVDIKPGDNGHSFCRISMWIPKDGTGLDFRYLDGKVFFSADHRILTFSTEGAGLVRNRSYLPFSIAVWANCWTEKTGMQWSVAANRESFIRAYQIDDAGVKTELRSDQLAISSRSRAFPYAPPALPREAVHA